MSVTVPELSFVVVISPSGFGKSRFARKNFKRTEVLSSDRCRALVADDKSDLAVTNEAFDTARGGQLCLAMETSLYCWADAGIRKSQVHDATRYSTRPQPVATRRPPGEIVRDGQRFSGTYCGSRGRWLSGLGGAIACGSQCST